MPRYRIIFRDSLNCDVKRREVTCKEEDLADYVVDWVNVVILTNGKLRIEETP